MLKKLFIFSFFFISPFVALNKSYAYDPCETSTGFNYLAQSECYDIVRPLKTKFLKESAFSLRAVLLTKSLITKNKKQNLILIPGGPGSDSQALRESLNSKDLLNAFWNHLNLNVILYDPRGTGASTLKKDARNYEASVFSTQNQVLDLKELISVVSPNRPVILLAHSAGGNIAARLSADYPNLVSGLIMYSASMDTREIGESNLRIFSKNPVFWKDFLKSLKNPNQVKDLEERREFIESFLRNVLKLQRIQKVRPLKLESNFYLKDFRIDLIKAVESFYLKNNFIRLNKVLKLWMSRIKNLPDEIKKQVFNQEGLSFDSASHKPLVLKRGTWIKTAVICSEGILDSEYKEMLWLEGLSFKDDTCNGFRPFYQRAPSKNWASNILAKTLFIAGSEDALEPLSQVKKNKSLISKASLKIFEGAGHQAHLTHSYEFFKLLEGFTESL